MSDSSDLQVDPRLDALLARALGRGSVSRQQRQRHLERLGLAPRLGGSAGRWQTPVTGGRHPSSTTHQPVSLPPRRRRRQWLELGAAVLAVVLVASLLVALFRDWGGDEDDQQLAASPEATEETVIPSPTIAPASHERLFAVSHTLAVGRDIIGGQVTAYNAESGEIVYAIETGENPDAVLSPDGTRLYVVANNEDGSGDTLTSYVALTGDKNWSVPIEDRVQWIRGEGPTTLAVSQDGSRLFVYSASAPGDYTIQVFDTADGRLGRVIDGVAGCTAQLFPSADGRSLYVVCMAERFAPQVIDLKAWTSAGVMQGFSGVITGAAATADGRYLYITHDIDTELRLTVIDTNNRAIAEQRDIVHLARDPLHSLNLTAVSADGSRLFIGMGMQPGETRAGDPTAREIWVWDTSELHASSIRSMVSAQAPIRGWSLASGPDNRSVYVNLTDSISRLSYNDLDAESEEFATRPDWEVLRLFSGRVTDTPQPPGTDEPEVVLPDLVIPNSLPLGLTLNSREPYEDGERLIFIGDDVRVIRIEVRPWREGMVLGPPRDAQPVEMGEITVYMASDPLGGWPRLASWHDSRFRYDLSVIESPLKGWTQNELLAVVAAFSSSVNGAVCPAASWTGPESRRLGGTELYWIDGESLSIGKVEGRLVAGANEVTFVTAPDNKIVDPDPNARVALSGTRLFTGYERAVPLQLLDQTVEWNVPAGDEVQVHIRSTIIFPTSGCWQIEAELGTSWLRTIVYVEPSLTTPELGAVWDDLRWRPLHEMGIDVSPPCVRNAPQQIVSDFGPVLGDMNANAGPVYMNGVSADGAMSIPEVPAEDGGYYARVMFITGGDYSGPLLIRAAAGSGPISYTLGGLSATPPTEWHLEGQGGTSPTPGVRHWIVYLRFNGPGCHALQIDGLDFTTIMAFETVPDARFNPAEAPAWDGSLYALSGNEGSTGVVELDPFDGSVRRRIDMIPYGNSYPHLEISPVADRLAVAGSLPGEEMRLDVLIYRLSDFTLLQRVPIPHLIQAFGVGDGLAFSPDGRFLYAYQYEAPPDGNGNNARYWLGTYDLNAQTWLADVELPACGTVTRMMVRASPYVYVQCNQTGLLNVDTATGTVERIDGGQQTASFQHFGNKTLLLTRGGAFYSGANWVADAAQEHDQFDIPAGWSVASLPFHVSGGFTFAYLPIQPSDGHYATAIAVVDLNTNTVTRTIQTSAPFREIVFAGDEQFAYVTLVGDDDFTTGIARIDLATGAETPLVDGSFGNLVAVSSAES